MTDLFSKVMHATFPATFETACAELMLQVQHLSTLQLDDLFYKLSQEIAANRKSFRQEAANKEIGWSGQICDIMIERGAW